MLVLGLFLHYECNTINYLGFDPAPTFIPKQKLAEYLSQSKYYQNESIDTFFATFLDTFKRKEIN